MKDNKALSKTKIKESQLDIDYLKTVLQYDPETGVMSWLRTTGKALIGQEAGGLSEQGYRRIKVDGIKYMAHRLAWAFIHNKFPEKEIDHVNNNRSDNRNINLREVDRSENLQNLNKPRADNQLGILGVCKRGNRYIAQVQVKGEKKHVSSHLTAEQAESAYKDAKEALHKY